MEEKISTISKITTWINRLIIGFTNISLLIITIVVVTEVISRKLFNHSFLFVTGVTSMLFPWIVFSAIILITKDNEHVSVNYFFNKVPDGLKKYVAIFNRVVMLFFSIFMMMSSYQLTIDVKDILIPILNISKGWYYSSMIIAFFASSVILLLQVITIAKDGKLGDDNLDLDYDN